MFFSSDKTIINNIQSEDKRKIDKAINLLYEKYFPVIQHYVLSNQGSPTDSQDIFQEAIFTLYKNVTQKKFFQSSSLKTYLYSISRNLWLTKLKKEKSMYNSIELESIVDLPPLVDDVEEIMEKEKSLQEGLSLLGKKCKDILIAFYYEGLSIDELSTRFKFSTTAIAKNQKYRCLTYLIETVKKSRKIYRNE